MRDRRRDHYTDEQPEPAAGRQHTGTSHDHFAGHWCGLLIWIPLPAAPAGSRYGVMPLRSIGLIVGRASFARPMFFCTVPAQSITATSFLRVRPLNSPRAPRRPPPSPWHRHCL